MGVCTLYVDFMQNKLIFHRMGYPMMMMMIRMIKGMTQRVWANDSIFIVTLRQRTTTTTATKYITRAELSTTKTCFCVYSSLSVFLHRRRIIWKYVKRVTKLPPKNDVACITFHDTSFLCYCFTFSFFSSV